MTTTDSFHRLARAVRLLEEHRKRVERLTEKANRLAGFDVVAVAGELAVLERFGRALDDGQQLLIDLTGPVDDVATLAGLERLVGQPGWAVLDQVAAELEAKEATVATARAEVEASLAEWSDLAQRVEAASQLSLTRRERVPEPRRLIAARQRMTALVRQANASFKKNKLLEVWQAISELERKPAGANVLSAREVPAQVEALLRRASAGPLQLTVLRATETDDRLEYTLMLLTPTGDQYVGINVQASSTIVRQDYERFVREAEWTTRNAYQRLRDAAIPAQAGPPAPAEDHLPRLRRMGHIFYRLLIPIGMREVIEQHPTAPLVVITDDWTLPWELMVADDFVSVKRPLARMPIGRLGSRRRPPTGPAQPRRRRRVALVGSAGKQNPLPAVEREVRLIAEGLAAIRGEEIDVDTFVTGSDCPADGDNFGRVLIAGDYDIIHYAGHATFDSASPDHSGLTLDEDEPCPAQKIQRLVAGTPLVFLNACETARVAADRVTLTEGSYQGDPRESLASAFLYGGALACIGNAWPVPDEVAADFAVTFYAHALEGLPLGESMRLARQEIRQRHPQDPSWASFVFYGDPGYGLRAFDSTPPPRPPGRA